MKEKEHLPMMGVGPIIVGGQILLTAIGITLSCCGYFDFAKIEQVKISLLILGIGIIVFGFILWFCANFKSKIDDGITNNRLVTTGVYAWVRNPIYSAFFFVCIGTVLIADNLFLLIIPVINWAYMTIFLKLTEEKWLYNLYCKEYSDYSKRVNRCSPWFPRKEN